MKLGSITSGLMSGEVKVEPQSWRGTGVKWSPHLELNVPKSPIVCILSNCSLYVFPSTAGRSFSDYA